MKLVPLEREHRRTVLRLRSDDFGINFIEAIDLWLSVGAEGTYWKVFAIIQDDRTIGVIGLYDIHERLTSDVPMDEALWLGWFGILPRYRRSGAGSAALALIEELAARDASGMRLYTSENNTGAHAFYEKNGYTRICTVGEYRKAFGKAHDMDECFDKDSDIIFGKTF